MCCLHLTIEDLEGFGDFKTGHINHTVKYADDLVVTGFGRNNGTGHDQ